MPRRRCAVPRCPRAGTGSPPICRKHRAFGADPLGQVVDAAFNHPRVAGIFDKIARGIDLIASKLDPDAPQPLPRATRAAPPPPQAPGKKDPRAVLEFPLNMPLTPELVRQRRKDLARAFHPDGTLSAVQREYNTRRMAEINAATDSLLASFARTRPASR